MPGIKKFCRGREAVLLRDSSCKLPRLLAIGQLLCATFALGQEPSSLVDQEIRTPRVETSLLAVDAKNLPTGLASIWPADMSQSYSGGQLGSNDSYQDLGPSLADCDDCPKRGTVLFVGYDSWKGVPDAGWQNNGIHSGLNFGTRLGRLSELTGIGFQIGGSAAAYNWGGTDFRIARQDQAQPQGFVTYGFFRTANADSNWSAAVVQDWMLNSNYGVFAENPTLSQGRAQLGYATSAFHEFGLWGTWRMWDDRRTVSGFGSVSWRAVNQINAFWHYKWSPGGADSVVWVGVPEHDRPGSNGGSLGDYLIGISGNMPLNDRAAVYTLVTYMHAAASAGPAGFEDEAWNFTIGLSLYPARNARSSTVAGQCWMPHLPVANNGYFLVDTNRTF
jgi:hypothetical protein